MRPERGCAFGAWALLVIGFLAGLVASWLLAPSAVLPPSCPPQRACEADDELQQCRSSVGRLQQHVLEAQQDYRRCLLSHSPTSAAVVRAGRTVAPVAADEGMARRRASLLQELDGVQLVPRPGEKVDIMMLWLNGTDEAWQFARNAGRKHSDRQHHDNGELLSCLRSLAKSGSALSIGTVHIVTASGQHPMWLRTTEAAGLPRVHVVSGDAGPAGDDVNVMMRRALEIPTLAESFLLWSSDVLLGKAAHRSDFWISEGGWGPRFSLSNSLWEQRVPLPVLPGSSVRHNLGMRPVPMSRRAVRWLLKQLPLDANVALVYVHWIIEHGLAGAVERSDSDTLTVDMAANVNVQELLRQSFAHTFVSLVNERGAKLPPLQAMLAERWNALTAFEE